MARYYLSKF